MPRRPPPSRILSSALVLALAAGWCAPAAALDPVPAAAVGGGGTFYKLTAGEFSQLFGENPALPADRAVLALDVVPAGQSLQRWVVPGTEGAEVESSPALLYDQATSTLHLVWSSLNSGNLVSSRLWLRSYGAEGWADAIDLSGGTLAEKRALRLAVTSDDYLTRIDGVDVRRTRRILHLVWVEDTAGAGARTFYSPVVFVDGQYVGWNPVVALDDLVTAETPSPLPAADSLREVPALEVGRAGDRVVIGFVDSRTRRIAAVEVRLLPGEIGQLADEARGHIIELAGTMLPGSPGELADAARGHIIELAMGFHPAVAGYVAQGVHDYLASADPATAPLLLGEGAQQTVLTLGDQVGSSGLANSCAGQGAWLELPPLVPQPGADFPHFFALRQIRHWNAPEIADHPPVLLISPDGERALVGWIAGTQLFYRESLPEGGFWSELRILDLTQVPFGDALTALAARLAGR